MKKKILYLLIVSTMLLMCACGNQSENSKKTENVISDNAETDTKDEPRTSVDNVTEEQEDVERLQPMVVVDGETYFSTGKESTIEARCGVMDGEITSTVAGSEFPTEDNQSNFGTGYGYQFVSEGVIEIQMEDGKWYVYEKEGWNAENPPVFVRVDNPSWDYYMAQSIQSDTKPFELKLIEEAANEIIDTEEWFTENNLPYVNIDTYYDEIQCVVQTGSSNVTLHRDGYCIAELDFTDYMYAPDLVEADREYVDEVVHDAKIKDNILYVSTFHYTYAASAPSNGYITAISLEDYSVIWKSQPLVCNSLNFEIVDDIIFCGYGFTAEDDYLYQLDRLTGCVLEQYVLRSKPDYIIYKDGKLYVRTYNTNYVMEVVK